MLFCNAVDLFVTLRSSVNNSVQADNPVTAPDSPVREKDKGRQRPCKRTGTAPGKNIELLSGETQ